MDIMATIVKNILNPIAETKNGSSVHKYLRENEETQRLSRQDLLALQWTRLKGLLDHAYGSSPFFRERFKKAGLAPSGIKTPEDFLRLPVLTKEDIQTHSAEILSAGLSVSGLIEDYTGGSTGKPLKFYYDAQRSQRRAASRIRHNRWCGWDVGQKMAVLWGASSDIAANSARQRLRNRFLGRTVSLDSFNMTVEKMEEYRKTLEEFKPAAILAYANSVYLFAGFLKNRVHSISPKGIICSAETLTDEKRELIESVFKCKAFDRYGSREVGLLASECEKHSGLHVNAENVYIEVVKDDGSLAREGELGRVIVTDLYNYAMPFIRYEIGDMAAAGGDRTCACGRGLPLIGSIEGRVSDFIVAPNGKIIHGEYFTHLFYGEKGVHQFQLVQEDLRNIRLNIVPSKEYSEPRLMGIKKQIEDYIGRDVNVVVEKVREIPKTVSGKYRFTISKVSLPHS